MDNSIYKYGFFGYFLFFNALPGPWILLGPKVGLGNLTKISDKLTFERSAHLSSALGFLSYYFYLNTLHPADPLKKKSNALVNLKLYAIFEILRHSMELIDHEVTWNDFAMTNMMWTGFHLLFFGTMASLNSDFLPSIINSSWMISVPILFDVFLSFGACSSGFMFKDYICNLL